MNDKFDNDSEKYRVIPHFKVERLIITYFVISVMVSACISSFLALSEASNWGISFIFYCLYAFPTIFLFGGLFSFLIEHKWGTPLIVKRNRIFKYMYKLFLYVIAGFIAINIFWLTITYSMPSFTSFKEFFLINDLGIAGALLFYHFLLLFHITSIFKTRSRERSNY